MTKVQASQWLSTSRAPFVLLLALLAACVAAQAPVPAAVRVATAAELRGAVQAGAVHIVVTEHLDLTQIADPDRPYYLFDANKSWKRTTRSLRVRLRPEVLPVCGCSTGPHAV